jgi:hypothetical protein
MSGRRHHHECREDEGSHDFGSLRFTWLLPIKNLIELLGNSLGCGLFIPNVNCGRGAFVLGSGAGCLGAASSCLGLCLAFCVCVRDGRSRWGLAFATRCELKPV